MRTRLPRLLAAILARYRGSRLTSARRLGRCRLAAIE
jgi:hypothetical protein